MSLCSVDATAGLAPDPRPDMAESGRPDPSRPVAAAAAAAPDAAGAADRRSDRTADAGGDPAAGSAAEVSGAAASGAALAAADMVVHLARIPAGRLDAEARLALAQAQAAALRLAVGLGGSDTLPLLEDGQFARLLELAGPEGAPELLSRLSEDLAAVEERLAAAAAAALMEEVRAQTHVLIALAGAVGAEPLHRLSRALNAAAHQLEGAGVGAAAPMAGMAEEAAPWSGGASPAAASGAGAGAMAGTSAMAGAGVLSWPAPAVAVRLLAGPVLAQLARLRRRIAAERALATGGAEGAPDGAAAGRGAAPDVAAGDVAGRAAGDAAGRGAGA